MPLRVFGDLLADVHGVGAPDVIALHGWGRRGADFVDVLDGLNAAAFDLPGFGASAAPREVIDTRQYASLVASALDVMEAGPFTLVGHSFGGRVAVRLGAARPDLVSGMLLTGVPLLRHRPPSRPSLGYRLLRSANRLGILSDDVMERIRSRRGSVDYRNANAVMRGILVATIAETYDADLDRLQCPIHLVWGADDTEVPPGVAEGVAAQLRKNGVTVELDVLDGVGHMVPLEAPDRLRTALLTMMQQRT